MPELKDRDNKAKMESEQFRKIFIGGLTYSTTEDMLREYYQRYGEVLDVIIMRDGQTKRSRGFGFVTFARSSMVDQCMANRPHSIDGKTVEPKRAIPKEEASQKPESGLSVKKLYVSGIKDDHSDQMLRDYFKDFGDVVDVSIMIDKGTGKPRGFAFVLFEDYDAVDKACLQKSHFIGGKRCDVKKALTKDEMKKVEQQDRDRKNRDFQTRGDSGFQARGGPYRNGRDSFGNGPPLPAASYDSRPWNVPPVPTGAANWSGGCGPAPPSLATGAVPWSNPAPAANQQAMFSQPQQLQQPAAAFDASRGYVSRSSSGAYSAGGPASYGSGAGAPANFGGSSVPGPFTGNVHAAPPYAATAPAPSFGGGSGAPIASYDWQQQTLAQNQARPAAVGGWNVQAQPQQLGMAPTIGQSAATPWGATQAQVPPQQVQQAAPISAGAWNPAGNPGLVGGPGINVGMNPGAVNPAIGVNAGPPAAYGQNPPASFNQPPQFSQNWGMPQQAWSNVPSQQPQQQQPQFGGLYR